MEKRLINPWQWQDARGYAQAVEVKNVTGTLYCAGQAAVLPDGSSSTADMETQLRLAIQNLEQVISAADYAPSGIVRLTVYTTSSEEFLFCFPILIDWVRQHGIQQATTLLEVKSLYETLKVELEATVVK